RPPTGTRGRRATAIAARPVKIPAKQGASLMRAALDIRTLMETWKTALTPLSFLARSAAVYPDAPALAYGDDTWTFAQLHAAVEQRARALRTAGVQPGDRVAYMMPNLPEMLIAQFAVPLIDAVLVSINTSLAPEEI